MAIKIITQKFDVYNKFSNLKVQNQIVFDKKTINETYITRIINNLNRYTDNVMILNGPNNTLVITKKKPFDFNIYFTKIK